MYRILSTYFVFFALGFTIESLAAELNIVQAIEKAQEQNLSVKVLKEKNNQLNSQVSYVKSSLFPTLQLTSTYNRQKSAATSSGVLPFGGNDYDAYNYDLHLVQPLVYFGLISAVDLAHEDLLNLKNSLAVSIRDLSIQVVQVFYQVLLYTKNSELLMHQQEILGDSLKTAQARYQNGRGQLLDVLQVKTQLSLIKPKIEDAKNQIKIASEQLSQLIGYSENDRNIKAIGSLDALDIHEVQSLERKSQKELPEIQKIEIQIEQVNEQKNIARGKHLPSLSLIGDLGATTYNSTDLFNNRSQAWAIGVQLTIPIFSGFSSKYEQEVLNSQIYQLQTQKKDTENTIELNQSLNKKSLETAQTSLISAKEAKNIALESVKEAQKNYKLSIIDFLQYQSVQQSSIEAETSLNQIKYNFLVSGIKYLASLGIDTKEWTQVLNH